MFDVNVVTVDRSVALTRDNEGIYWLDCLDIKRKSINMRRIKRLILFLVFPDTERFRSLDGEA